MDSMKPIHPTNHDSLSTHSREYLARRPKAERSPLGQFLTPRALREALVEKVELRPGMMVLDPGVGTGEFLRTCLDREPGLECHGWDVDPEVLDPARALVPNAHLENKSALDAAPNEVFDLVIGNPPYYEIRTLDADARARYSRVISGRPNIFALFFLVGYNALKPGGTLAFVVPPSMNNGAYFNDLRSFILDSFSIEYLKVFEDPFLFEDAQTAVQLIVLRKGGNHTKYSVDLSIASNSPKERTIFTESPDRILSMYQGNQTLHNLGYVARTGTVVWNTKKSQLVREASKNSIPLIWAHNIGGNGEIILQPEHSKRPQYITGVQPFFGPAIAVNRITGSVGSGNLRCALIPESFTYVCENHVNVVTSRQNCDQKIDWPTLLKALRRPETNERIRLLTGNTQVSATELTHWVPLTL